MVEKPTECYILYTILQRVQQVYPSVLVIVIGMWTYGRETRVVCPMLWSLLTFAKRDYTGSALGQLHLEEMETIFNTLA